MGSSWMLAVKEIILWRKLVDSTSTVIDNRIFSLHYRLSLAVIFFTSILYTLFIYNGLISCVFPPKSFTNEDVAKTVEVIDDLAWMCWAKSLYTVTLASDNGNDKRNEIAPGVFGLTDGKHENVTYHDYYRWLPFLLLTQLIIFIAPRYLWMCVENGKMEMLTKDLTTPIIKEENLKKKKMLAEYFVACLTYNNSYGFAHAFCEVLNLVSVILQIYLLDRATGYVFSSYGPEVFTYTMGENQENRVDPMAMAFPLVAKCTFNIHGPSGNIVPHSAICSLPMNIVSERYFVFMWFYLTVLAILNVLNIIYRISLIASRDLRQLILYRVAYCTPKKLVRNVLRKCQYGDWFILFQLGQNIDGPIFKDILEDIAVGLQEHKSSV